MDNKVFVINLIITITDTLIAALAIIAFAWGAQRFEHWWMLLCSLIPVAMFNAHTLILDEQREEGGEKDS